jgi:heme exporter protein A
LSVANSSLEARDLACVRGERAVFAGLSFSVRNGELLEIVGPNGSGKSSLLRIAARLLAPAAGTVSMTDEAGREPQSLVHLISHLDGLKAAMSANETISFYGDLLGRGPAAAAGNVLAQVGLERQRDLPVQFLSAGQRRRLALARLLVAPRPIWLLDEPLASLDAAGRKLVVSLISKHLAEGGLVLAATHDPIVSNARRVTLGAAA